VVSLILRYLPVVSFRAGVVTDSVLIAQLLLDSPVDILNRILLGDFEEAAAARCAYSIAVPMDVGSRKATPSDSKNEGLAPLLRSHLILGRLPDRFENQRGELARDAQPIECSRQVLARGSEVLKYLHPGVKLDHERLIRIFPPQKEKWFQVT